MNERDWLTTTDALALLDHLFPIRGLDSIEPQSQPSRLYLLGCARRAWDQFPGVCRAVAALAERVYCERTIDRGLREAVYHLAEELIHCRGEADRINTVGRGLVDQGHADAAAVWAKDDMDPDLWIGFAYLTYSPFSRTTPEFRRIPPELHSTDLVREVFANPFTRQPEFDAAWRSEDVVQLASHAYAAGDFSALPALADALEEAGCDRDDILRHLRSGGPHIRGCWALELVLK